MRGQSGTPLPTASASQCWHDLVRTGEGVRSAHDHQTAVVAEKGGELVGAAGEGQVHRDTDHLRQWLCRDGPLEEVFIPEADRPIGRRYRGKARERQRRGQHMLAKAPSRVLGIERADEQRGPRQGDGSGRQRKG